MTRAGVLLVACGDALYGRLAFNCAVSLKQCAPDLPIALAHTPSALASLGDEQLSLFDHRIDASAFCDPEEGDFIRPKAFLYELSPFDATLFLDADTLWSPEKRVSDLLAELRDVEFTTMNYTRYPVGGEGVAPGPYTYWASPEELAEHYGVHGGYLYQQSTTFLWFRRCPRVERFCRTVADLYTSPRQILRVLLREMRPDELYYNVAGNLTGVHPHLVGYQPVYFFMVHHAVPTDDITRRFWAVTTAGKYHTDAFLDLVRGLLAHYAERSGRALFPLERRHAPAVLEEARRKWGPQG